MIPPGRRHFRGRRRTFRARFDACCGQTAAALRRPAAWSCRQPAPLRRRVRLADESDRAAFRSWFVLLADAQFERPTADVTDCAALVRHALREALRAHTPEWVAARSALPFTPQFADVRSAPRAGADGWPLFRITRTPRPRIAEFADAKTLVRPQQPVRSAATLDALPGPATCSTSGSPGSAQPDHLMVFVGRSHFESEGDDWVVYHTGPSTAGQAKCARCGSRRCVQHPAPRWRPLASNPELRRRVPAGHRYETRSALLRFAVCSLALRLLAATPLGAGPTDERPAFSLSTSEVFTTRDAPNFYLTFRRIPQLDFRVYKVQRPVRVLRRPRAIRISSAASEADVPAGAHAGSSGSPTGSAASASGLRRSCAARSSHDYRVTRRAGDATRREVAQRVVLNVNTFAQVPLLNPDQLVTSWRELLPESARPEVRRVPLDVKAAGHLRRRSRQRSAARLHDRHRVGRRPGHQDRRRARC